MSKSSNSGKSKSSAKGKARKGAKKPTAEGQLTRAVRQAAKNARGAVKLSIRNNPKR